MWGHFDTTQYPVGLLGIKPFCVPPLLLLQEICFIQPLWPSLSSKGQIPTIVNQGRKVIWRQGRNSQETTAQPQGRVLVPHQGIHTTSLSWFADTETPTRREKLTVNNSMLPISTQIPDWLEPEDWWCLLPLTSPTTNQKIVHELVTPSLNYHHKTPH